MEEITISLAFIKLYVEEMEPAEQFWREAFGFERQMVYDEPGFVEHILSIPGAAGGMSLMLVQPKPAVPLVAGNSHGPVGLSCNDIVTTLEAALAAGGVLTMPVTEVAPGVRVCLLHSPQGHEIELVQAGG